eukprot:912480-Rhodomonas_salina.2
MQAHRSLAAHRICLDLRRVPISLGTEKKKKNAGTNRTRKKATSWVHTELHKTTILVRNGRILRFFFFAVNAHLLVIERVEPELEALEHLQSHARGSERRRKRGITERKRVVCEECVCVCMRVYMGR